MLIPRATLGINLGLILRLRHDIDTGKEGFFGLRVFSASPAILLVPGGSSFLHDPTGYPLSSSSLEKKPGDLIDSCSQGVFDTDKDDGFYICFSQTLIRMAR
ncbi:hypothetical protein Tco_0503824 [Tanacetum coccineum]